MVIILTANEFLRKGLEMVGFDRRRQQRVKRATNIQRFKDYYGSRPIVYAQIWEDLQTTDIQDARIDSSKCCVESFLMAIHFLKCYPTEGVRAGTFNICERTARDWGWYYVRKVQALKKQKVSLADCCYM